MNGAYHVVPDGNERIVQEKLSVFAQPDDAGIVADDWQRKHRPANCQYPNRRNRFAFSLPSAGIQYEQDHAVIIGQGRR